MIHFGMTELEFIEEIDGGFSFDSDEEYENATRIACAISDNAALMVGYELATLSSRASIDVNLKLLHIMKVERPTPVIIAAIPVIKSMLEMDKANPDGVQLLLEACRKHGKAWNGLGIVECADDSLEGTCRQIRESWKGRS